MSGSNRHEASHSKNLMERALLAVKRTKWGAVGSACAISAILVAWTAWATHGDWIADALSAVPGHKNAGEWGDTFGALNALFAGLAFGGVLITLWLQTRSLREQQDDQHHQKFESLFFKLLSLLRELKGDIRFRLSTDYRTGKKLSGTSTTRRGALALRDAVLEARYWISRHERLRDTPPDREMIGEIYTRSVHARYESALGPYFRMVYTILHRIRSDSVLTEEEKDTYGNLLRSQLTSHEVALCGLNGLSPISKDFYDLVVRFRLLKYLPVGPMRSRLERYYPVETFQSRD